MGLDPSLLPSRVLERMNPLDKPKGSAGWTSLESQERGARRQELEHQKSFAKWLRFKGIPFYNPRSDQKSTITIGAADFSVFWDDRTIFLEFKAPGCHQSEEQKDFELDITRCGFKYFVVYSDLEAVLKCREFFGSSLES
jgi:hypothetical protein